MKNRTIITVILATFLTTDMMLSTAIAAPKNCASKYVSAIGSSTGDVVKLRISRAKRRAASDWEETVAGRHSVRYSDFEKAYNPFFSCRLNAFGGTTCIVTALPCDDS